MKHSAEKETTARPSGGVKAWRLMKWIVWKLILTTLVLSAIGSGMAAGFLYSFYTELPDINRLEEFRPSLVTKVYDKNETLIGEFFIEKRDLITYNQLPQDYVNALLAVEDQRFFEHFGVDPVGFGRAMLRNLQAGRLAEGASTITQQLTRNLFLSPEKKVVRKIKEMMLALKIEQKYRSLEGDQRQAKERILELYANQVYLGHGAYGVQAAAQVYFGKDVSALDLGECAMLAGIPQRPAAYSPIRFPEQAKARQTHVLKRMAAEGYITPDAQTQSTERPFETQPAPTQQVNEAPYFIEYVRQYLEERYGYRVYQDGLQVYTTLDLRLQKAAEATLQEHLRNLQKRRGFKLFDRDKTPAERAERLKFFEQQEWKQPPQIGERRHGVVTGVSGNQIAVRVGEYQGVIPPKGFAWTRVTADKLVKPDDIILVKIEGVDQAQKTLTVKLDLEPILEGALLSVDPKTGDVLAMVGGYDFHRSKFNRAVQALRQPGSCFKPFVYLTALEHGYTPADILIDEPTNFEIDPNTHKKWTPKNYSGNFKGPMTLRYALEHSTNVIAAKLIDELGPYAIIDTARRLGITTYLNPYPSLALGGSEVYMWEIVAAYCSIANRGYRVEPIVVTKVLDSENNLLEENVPRAQQVIPEDTAYLLISMMNGVVERGTAGDAKKLGRPLAGKTGTTNDNTDAWFIGYSPSLVAAVWLGYDENRKSLGKGETGGKIALPIWMDFMAEALKETPVEDFPVPAGVNLVQIDTRTGLLFDSRCAGEPFTEVFRKGTEPREYCYQFRGYSSAR